MEQIGLHLDGHPAAGIDPHALVDGLAGLVKLANAVEGNEDRPPDWVMSELSLGSVKCAVRPAPGQETAGDRRMRLVWRGAQQLRTGAGIPTGWTEHAVRAFLDLAKLTRCSGVDSAALTASKDESLTLDESVKLHAERSLQSTSEVLTTVRGTIVRYLNDGARREVGIRELPSGRPLRVIFPLAMAHDLKVALLDDLPISVRGVLKKNGEGQRLSLTAEGLTVLPGTKQPTFRVRDMSGTLGKDWTSGLNSVDWVRSQRG